MTPSDLVIIGRLRERSATGERMNTAYIALGISIVALVLAVVMSVNAAGMKKKFSVLQGSGSEVDFVTAVARQVEQVNGLRTDVANLRKDLTISQGELRDALRHVAVVRYDAFGDVGGRMSFSVAFLDDSNDGIVISSINGRTEGRTYIKGIKAGNSVGSELSPEEIQVIQMAQRDK